MNWLIKSGKISLVTGIPIIISGSLAKLFILYNQGTPVKMVDNFMTFGLGMTLGGLCFYTVSKVIDIRQKTRKP